MGSDEKWPKRKDCPLSNVRIWVDTKRQFAGASVGQLHAQVTCTFLNLTQKSERGPVADWTGPLSAAPVILPRGPPSVWCVHPDQFLDLHVRQSELYLATACRCTG